MPLKWGLIPSWAKDPKIGQQCLNARAETVAEKPAFRSDSMGGLRSGLLAADSASTAAGVNVSVRQPGDNRTVNQNANKAFQDAVQGQQR